MQKMEVYFIGEKPAVIMTPAHSAVLGGVHCGMSLLMQWISSNCSILRHYDSWHSDKWEACTPFSISAEDCVISPTAIWVKLGRGYDLLPEDKCLIESGKWLNDRIINAWQLLLQRKHVHIRGFHPTVLIAGRKNVYTCVQGAAVAQVVNENDHWVAISSVGCSGGVV